MIKKNFSKNLLMSLEDKRRFQWSNKYWVWNKLFVAGGNKVRDYDNVRRKYRGSAHWSCNINLKLTKNSCNIS